MPACWHCGVRGVRGAPAACAPAPALVVVAASITTLAAASPPLGAGRQPPQQTPHMMLFPMSSLLLLFASPASSPACGEKEWCHLGRRSDRGSTVPPSSRCGITRRSIKTLTPQTFAAEFRDLHLPVLIEGHRPVKRARKHFQRGALLKAAAAARVRYGGAAEIVRAHGEGPHAGTLGDFLVQMRNRSSGDSSGLPTVASQPYLFDRGGFFEQPASVDLRRRLPFPASMLRQRARGERPPSVMGFLLDGAEAGSVEDQGGEPRPDHDTYLLIGGNGSSVSFHAHADSIVAVLFGEKRWWLVPPGTRPRPRWRHPAGMATWAGSDAAQSVPEAVECVQMPGELLFVPESWHHATLNYGETVAVAQQSRVGSSLWLRLRLLGTQLVQSRAWTDALEVLEETLRRYPAEPESYSALALLLMDILDPTPFTAGGGAPPALSQEQASSMWGRAEALLFQSLALDPNDSAVHTNLCKILTMQGTAKDGGDRGRLGHQRAATHCNRAVELDENRYARTYQYACTHCRKVAVASFEASACMPGVSFHAQFYSATQLATRGEHKRAVERFMIACALDKNSAEAHYQLSRSMLLQLDPERSSDAQKLLLRGTIAAGHRAAQLLCNRCRVNAPNPTQDCKCSGASTAEQTLSLLNSMDAETQQAVRVFNKPLATMLLSSDERREDAALRAEL